MGGTCGTELSWEVFAAPFIQDFTEGVGSARRRDFVGRNRQVEGCRVIKERPLSVYTKISFFSQHYICRNIFLSNMQKCRVNPDKFQRASVVRVGHIGMAANSDGTG
jgi:hypothetical protein